MNNHTTHTLANGLRIIHEPSPTNVVYCGYIVGAGTRDERPDQTGMAHFLEHLSFKGTARRRAWHILNGLERVGGDLNAYTHKEMTVYHAAILRKDFARAADLLSDIVFRSIYPQREIDREVAVIIDEIESYKDSPPELIYDEFEELLFRTHPLGRSILGEDAEQLRTYRSDDFRLFANRYYQPANATFFVYGRLPFERIVRSLERHTADLPASITAREETPLPAYVATERIVKKHTHQAHVLIGNRACGAYDANRIGLSLLTNLLGGAGMNARLNVSLREKHGLVYTVESNLTHYRETGVWSVYFGCDRRDVVRCRQLVLHELQQLRDEPLSDSQLRAAKKQLKGQIGISCDNFENYALTMGKVFALYGHRRSLRRLCEQIDALTAVELQGIAAGIFDESQLTTLIYE